ncbi:unnamed protein product [Phaedon cochleariae]|uniref:Motile sperm domain-containing protein 2 n=1 Tax=Phaedon cochleariae TaxID=80249 RepID=A0A9P0DIG2_PHACE|nr:unnamed protein product [Phaedon cochleariae]
MVKGHMEISNSQIQDLRNAFLNDLASKGNNGVHPNDLERVKTSDDWLQRFLLHNDGDQTLALKMLWTSVTWRLENNVNELSESKCKMELLCSGAFYPFGADIDGCVLLVFKCKKHVKGAVEMAEIKKCILYWFERIERLVKGNQITIFFDMEGCGLSNMDLELIKYLINLFKEYYPYFLNYILIFEMPWILNAAFKIVKSMLPEKAVEKIKFISKKDIKTYVGSEHILTCWGGDNTYTFDFVSEPQTEIEPVPTAGLTTNKKVHFMDGSMSEISAGSGEKESDGSSLKVTPSGIITFVKDGNELVSTLELQNTDGNTHLSYKLKTTSPEKFRVKPSTGCLAPGESAIVTVTLLVGFQLGGLSRDKFLVMSTPLEASELSNLDLSELWKNQSNRKVNQHRLKCIQSGGEVTNNGSINPQRTTSSQDADPNSFNKLSAALSKLDNCQHDLQKSVKTLQYYQLATILLVILLGVVLGYMIRATDKEYSAENSYCKDVNHL